MWNILKKIFNLQKDFQFLPKTVQSNKNKKLICSIENKEKYVVHITALKQALDHRLKFKNVQKVIQFKQKA